VVEEVVALAEAAVQALAWAEAEAEGDAQVEEQQEGALLLTVQEGAVLAPVHTTEALEGVVLIVMLQTGETMILAAEAFVELRFLTLGTGHLTIASCSLLAKFQSSLLLLRTTSR
jgi:hypothetical protein